MSHGYGFLLLIPRVSLKSKSDVFSSAAAFRFSIAFMRSRVLVGAMVVNVLSKLLRVVERLMSMEEMLSPDGSMYVPSMVKSELIEVMYPVGLMVMVAWSSENLFLSSVMMFSVSWLKSPE